MTRLSRLRLAAGASTALGLLLVGCTATTAPAPSPSATEPPTSASPSSEPTPEDSVVTISVDGVSVDGATAAYTDADAVIQALTDALGADPTESPVDGPYGETFTAYEWTGLTATLREPRIDVFATADSETVSYTTPEGIGLGSTRDEALTAGAQDEWDEDGDGVADYLKIGMREVAGTTSLENPGQVGVEYLTLTLTDDVVTAIASGGNDFSDL